MSRLRLMPLLFALVACGQSDALDSSQSSFYEPWVSGDVASGAASGEAPGTAGSPYDASQDGEGFVDGHRFEAFFFGEATVTPGSSLEGIGEFWAMRWDDEEEVILCEASWNVASVQSVPACEGCTFAFRVRYSNVSIINDVAGTCEAEGFSAAQFEGMEFVLGYRSEEVLTEVDGEWEVAGEASYTDAESSFEYYMENFY